MSNYPRIAQVSCSLGSGRQQPRGTRQLAGQGLSQPPARSRAAWGGQPQPWASRTSLGMWIGRGQAGTYYPMGPSQDQARWGYSVSDVAAAWLGSEICSWVGVRISGAHARPGPGMAATQLELKAGRHTAYLPQRLMDPGWAEMGLLDPWVWVWVSQGEAT